MGESERDCFVCVFVNERPGSCANFHCHVMSDTLAPALGISKRLETAERSRIGGKILLRRTYACVMVLDVGSRPGSGWDWLAGEAEAGLELRERGVIRSFFGRGSRTALEARGSDSGTELEVKEGWLEPRE